MAGVRNLLRLIAPFVIVGLLVVGGPRGTCSAHGLVDEPEQSHEGIRGLNWPEAWLRCWVDQCGLSPSQAAAAQMLVGEGRFVVGFTARAPSQMVRMTAAELGSPRLPLDTLLQGGVPLWRAIPAGDEVVSGTQLSVTHGINACLPYPVKSISLMPRALVRGRTAAVVIETDRISFCRVAYLGHDELCYREGNTRFIALVGVSALVEPGEYPLEIRVIHGGGEVSITVPLQVDAGRYGYQYINPPAQLRGLMTPEVMDAEAEYLSNWRGIRSTERLWDFPLSLPLNRSLAITADYGDRRSYGGMVDGYHSGIDYSAWSGLPVIAPADGVVVMAEWLTTRGNAVLLDHGWGLVTGYWHLSEILVDVGDRVSADDVFARVGSTGLSTGAHLHWEVWANGESVDGKQWLSADGFEGLEFAPIGEAASDAAMPGPISE